MKDEKIKIASDGYYAGNVWESKEQEISTKIGWQQGFTYALIQFAATPSDHSDL